MDKKDILEKSKEEFKNSDPYIVDVRNKYLNNGLAVGIALSLIFFLTELIVKGELNLGFMAINCVSTAALNWAEYKLHPKKSRLVIAIIASLAVVIAAVGYILSLFLGK